MLNLFTILTNKRRNIKNIFHTINYKNIFHIII